MFASDEESTLKQLKNQTKMAKNQAKDASKSIRRIERRLNKINEAGKYKTEIDQIQKQIKYFCKLC